MENADETCNALRLEKQLCFTLYACAREMIKQYKPFLDKLGLTYTQYITMIVLWSERSLTVKELGSRLFLDSGTLTPLLKKMETKGLITRKRSPEDERNLIISITDEGMLLREAALKEHKNISGHAVISDGESEELYRILYKILGIPA